MDEAMIIGAGPGGITLAIALRKAGIGCTVYERDREPDPRDGQLISLGANGLEALRQVDVKLSGISIPWLDAYSGSGRLLGKLYNGPEDPSAPTSLLVDRLKYRRQLYDIALERGVHFEHGKRLRSYGDDGRKVTASFEDGSSVAADVLIGADGVHSATRRVMFPHAHDAIYTGMLGLGGSAHTPRLRPTPEAMICLFGWEAFFSYHVDENDNAHWMTFAPWEGPLHVVINAETESWKPWLGELFQRDMGPIREVIECGGGHMDVHPVYDVQGLPAWFSGRTALIGDAARTAPPRIGVGASLAVEDAVTVAKCLRDIEDPVRAFETYQAMRWDRVRKINRWGRMYARPPKVRSGFGMWLREVGMPPLMRLLPSLSSMDWIYGYRVPWDEPIDPTGARRK